MHHATPLIVAALALAAALPASADTPVKASKVHAVNLKSRAASKPAATPRKEVPVKTQMAQEPAPAEPAYDYASCGCS